MSTEHAVSVGRKLCLSPQLTERLLSVCLQASKQAEITKLQEEITKVNLLRADNTQQLCNRDLFCSKYPSELILAFKGAAF